MKPRRRRHLYVLVGKRVTLRQLAVLAGRSERSIMRRLHVGETPEQIVAAPMARGKLLLDGRRITVAEVAVRAGITSASVGRRLRAGMTPSEIVQKGPGRVRDLSCVLRLDGKVISAEELSRLAGVNVRVIRTRLLARMTPEQIIAAPRWWKGLWLGNTPVSAKDIAIAAGVSVSTVRKDLKSGRAPSTIVAQGKNRRGKKLEIEGETLRSSEVVELAGVSVSVLKARLKSGWGVVNAISTPTRVMGRGRRPRAPKTWPLSSGVRRSLEEFAGMLALTRHEVQGLLKSWDPDTMCAHAGTFRHVTLQSGETITLRGLAERAGTTVPVLLRRLASGRSVGKAAFGDKYNPTPIPPKPGSVKRGLRIGGLTVSEIAKRFGLAKSVVRSRHKAGWTPERIMQPRRKRLDITGQIYGQLTVLGLSVKKPKNWRCLCSCGRETDVQAHDLTCGRQVSCGCHRNRLARTRRIGVGK